MSAALSGHTSIVKILLEKGAKIDLLTYNNYNSAIWLAASKVRTESH